jgi:hypothetical protein
MSVELYINTRTWELTVNDETIELGISVGYPTYEVATQAEAEAGTETELRAFSPVRIAQAIAALESGDTPPGGDDAQIQFNDEGEFGGADQLTWDKDNYRLRIGVTEPTRLTLTGKAIHTVVNDSIQHGDYNINLEQGNDHIVTVDGDITLGFSNLSAGMSGLISLIIDNTGGYTVTLHVDFNAELNGSDTIDNSANAKNLISWWYDGTYVYYSVTNTA